ncbi:MAG: beta-lactamase family protein [Chloroflexaceae bacterium]|nr:beta-lactamase family protein [Chloroflexaceae bacterium]
MARRVFPGAVVLVARDGVVRHFAAYGSTRYDDQGSQPVTTHTRYDLASLTKAFTATAALRLYDEGVLSLDTPASHYLPGLRASGVTVRHLLTHTSGLSLRLASLRHLPADDLRAAVYAIDPVRLPGTQVAYVNINSLLLGDIVAHLSGMPLDQAMTDLVLSPLGMHDTCFCPPASLRPHTAPTEWDEEWRGGLVQGTVHDDSAHAMGGVAGHAGLFGPAADLWRFGQMWLDGGRTEVGGPATQLLRRETVAMATRIQTAGLALPSEGVVFHCGWGWMMGHSVIMGRAPAGTYGHTGFTGPAIMMVPAHHLGVVLLSNRTYPRRTPPVHHEVTAALLEAALEG